MTQALLPSSAGCGQAHSCTERVQVIIAAKSPREQQPCHALTALHTTLPLTLTVRFFLSLFLQYFLRLTERNRCRIVTFRFDLDKKENNFQR